MTVWKGIVYMGDPEVGAGRGVAGAEMKHYLNKCGGGGVDRK